jgi:negative regulator of flagellin synthesis FlgM
VKINWSNPQVDLLKADLPASAAKNSSIAQPSGAEQKDEANFSSSSQRVSQLAIQAANAPEVRQERVEALRQRVQSGEYKVDARRVAEAMFSDLSLPEDKG